MSKGGQRKSDPEFEVTYFNGRGRGEFVRLILEAYGAKYKDNRVDFPDWPALKPKTPLGSMPILKINGEQIPQTFAIIRTLGRELDMYGKDRVTQSKVDVLLETIKELVNKAIALTFGDMANKELAEALRKDEVPDFFAKLQKMIRTLEPKGDFAAGDEMTIADLSLYHCIALVDAEDHIAKFDTLKEICEKVASVPNVKEYLERRPEGSSCIF